MGEQEIQGHNRVDEFRAPSIPLQRKAGDEQNLQCLVNFDGHKQMHR